MSNIDHNPIRIRAIQAFLLLAFALACALIFALPAAAYAADNVQLDAPTTVSDDITRLHVNKLDSDTHEYVSGATMAIINEQTGEVVDSWVTSAGTHENEKSLDVDVVYILREISAPDGYDKVDDVRFVVNATEGEGITILSSGEGAELTESYKVALYDKPQNRENVITVTQSNDSTPTPETSTTNKVVAPKTGDETPLTTVAALSFAGVALILILQLVKRRISR